MESIDLKVNKYFAPMIEMVATETVSLEELIVACFHCDPATSRGTIW